MRFLIPTGQTPFLKGVIDPELITPLYVYRMWGGKVPLNEIERAMEEMAACGLNEG